jgi:hypothetical protein
VQGNLQIKLTDSSITLAPMNINGIPFPNDAFVGVRVGGAGSLIARSAVLTEGPRQNGHQFVVKMDATDTASFFFAREDPPGTGIESVVTITGRVTYEFHDGSLSGTIYTTCIEQDSIAGGKF